MAMHAAAAPHHASENIGISRGMAGMALFIGSEIMLFGGLFAAYFFVRNQADAGRPNPSSIPSPKTSAPSLQPS
jgi:heme/copper-type cytochrome/quinol oxidase subunit 3